MAISFRKHMSLSWTLILGRIFFKKKETKTQNRVLLTKLYWTLNSCHTTNRKINECRYMDIDKVFCEWKSYLNTQIIHRGETWVIAILSSSKFRPLRNLQQGLKSLSQSFLPQDIEHGSVFATWNSSYKKKVLQRIKMNKASLFTVTYFSILVSLLFLFSKVQL